MNIKVAHIEQLLLALAKKTRQSLDSSGFKNMSDVIHKKTNQNIDSRYLNESLHQKIEGAKKKGVQELKFQIHRLNQLAEFLNHDSFLEFIDAIEKPLNPILKSSLGVYYCYLRRNTEQAVILSSPVRIFETAEKQVVFELRGPDQTYSGNVVLKNNCLFILMQAQNGKEFHHVYRIGQKLEPKVLQGIFSGVSTSSEPIGGRVILIRTDMEYEIIQNQGTEITMLKNSKHLTERRIAEYFSNYTDNNLSLLKSMTFGIDDLGKCM
ncbi:hypothetical protein SanaruYs_03210 [Chryseotalea sanaruensis]|uniref:Uncharacterized protein n=1 Tax=Chryseotalea sanaruensis TaxID=2482724 RepID=A0A401U5P2_9BACT|nr:hypothetical protein [Chryseotalea sanaruensis]GCC50106.1 hypothetical protein SanaruYs_03210 [Chryseotalea sanaruensis]